MKVKTTIHIHHQQYSWQDQGEFVVYSCQLEDAEHRTYVGEQEIEIEVPDDYDPRGQKIDALEKYKLKIMGDYQKMVTEINERISKLKALEYTA